MKYSSSLNKSNRKNDQFAIYYLAQALAYEEAIEIVKQVFHDEMKGEEWQ